jgi:hypothetical protein
MSGLRRRRRTASAESKQKDVIVKNPGEQPMQYGKKLESRPTHVHVTFKKTPDDPTDLRNLGRHILHGTGLGIGTKAFTSAFGPHMGTVGKTIGDAFNKTSVQGAATLGIMAELASAAKDKYKSRKGNVYKLPGNTPGTQGAVGYHDYDGTKEEFERDPRFQGLEPVPNFKFKTAGGKKKRKTRKRKKSKKAKKKGKRKTRKAHRSKKQRNRKHRRKTSKNKK